MLDGSMMYKLRNLLNQETADENPAFLYITPEHVYECQIFSVYRTTIYDDYIWFQFFGDDDFLDYVEMMKNKSEVSFPDCGITAEDSILTISTCNRSLINDGTGRMAVYAKIVRIR
jgi:sortase B